MASVTLTGVHKAYGTTPVVKGVDLHIPQGARCVLLGQSGCGKTTTLRMVAGLESPDSGEILLDGQPVASPAKGIHVPPERRGLGMVFQSYALWPHMSVFENVAYPLRRQGVDAQQVPARVKVALQRVQLETLGDRMPHALSGGQQQRVALARALAAQPRVLLADEPLSNLDARLRDGLRAQLASLSQDAGITLIHVTHDQAEALALATHVAVMDAGRIAQLGPPDEVYSRPASLVVASFMGETHTVPGVVEAAAVRIGGVSCTPRRVSLGPEGSACLVALRPEDVVVGAPQPTSLAGVVRLSSCIGSQWMVDVETAAGMVRARVPETAAVGTHVGLAIMGGHAFAA